MFYFLKQLVRYICDRYPSYSSEKLISKIKNYEVISFDIFDTLIKRNLNSPKDVFKLVADKLFENDSKKERFINQRVNAEQKARIFYKQEEVTLPQIIECLGDEFSGIKQKLIETEQEIEYEVSYANPQIKKVYEWCLKNNKKIIIVSDMYLSECAIKRILYKCGYSIYLKLYISSEIGLRKSTGNLYKFIAKDLSISSKKIVHIGDSLRGDFIYAKKNKLSAIRIATSPIRTKYIKKSFSMKHIVWRDINTVLSGHLYGNESLFYLYGIEVLSPLLLGFSNWLNNELTKKGIKKVFFLARDGFLLQKSFFELFPENSLEIKYLYVSRKALRRPALYLVDCFSDFISFIPTNRFLSKEDMYDLFNLTDKEISFWNKAGFKDEEILFTSNLIENKKLNHFYELIKNSPLTKKSYEDYLQYLSLNDFSGNVGIVDIGWAGTIQKSLQKICSNASIHGFYVGLTKLAEKNIKGIGYIPSKYNPQIATAGLFEYPFLADEGSLKNITIEKGEININLCEYEYSNDPNNLSYIHEIQKGVIDGLRILKKIPNSNLLIDPNISYRELHRITKKPSLNEAKIFGTLNFYDGVSRPLASPKSLLSYSISPKKFIKDFSDSGWKVGFLRRLLRLPLPYAALLDYVRNK